ncbi:TadE/TadG family type IV pilus assembly protein [Pseudaestuariivita atlantica]|uniref:Pilus assembly protein TadE n=1 Tax=Pseudaestuariivita atlantica TaxID=1317121 RepID=A0A0L1JLU4_9RHOB|nr:hypothetical protein [Pseudaestuariivita atlantica]KNG92721.1 hypothetical protein ATO11_16720 [Pseudaestuariivita atlantica]
MTSKLNTLFARFRKDEEANLSVEAIILLPVLLWAFMAMFIFFDNFRSHSVAQKAAYTIGDMISRETDYIDPTYMTNAYKLLQFLSESEAADTSLRVTVVKYNANKDRYQRVWSKKKGAGYEPLNNTQVKKLANKLPNMVHNEQLILVETKTRYDSVSDIGLLGDEVETFVFTRPRFAPQVMWNAG